MLKSCQNQREHRAGCAGHHRTKPNAVELPYRRENKERRNRKHQRPEKGGQQGTHGAFHRREIRREAHIHPACKIGKRESMYEKDN